MMKPRLELAKSLLKDQGLIAISIDDNELYHLKLLMDGVFGSACYKGTLVIKKGAGIWNKKNIRKDHEYLLIYEKMEGFSQFYFPKKRSGEKEKALLKSGRMGDRNDNASLWYSIICPKHQRKVWPINSKGIEKAWTISKERTKTELKKQKLFCSGNDEKCSLKIRYLPLDQEQLISVWNINSRSGTLDLQKDLPTIKENSLFDYPKSTQFLQKLFEYLSPANGLILDFFAGSGTTGCAVAELNKKNNNSKRKFILVTNNQGDSYQKNKVCVFQNVLYPRLTKNLSDYQLSVKTFVLTEDLNAIKKDDDFYSKQSEYINTCFCLLSILQPDQPEWSLSFLRKNNYSLKLNGKKYGFFGSIGKDLDINMAFSFYLKK